MSYASTLLKAPGGTSPTPSVHYVSIPKTFRRYSSPSPSSSPPSPLVLRSLRNFLRTPLLKPTSSTWPIFEQL